MFVLLSRWFGYFDRRNLEAISSCQSPTEEAVDPKISISTVSLAFSAKELQKGGHPPILWFPVYRAPVSYPDLVKFFGVAVS